MQSRLRLARLAIILRRHYLHRNEPELPGRHSMRRWRPLQSGPMRGLFGTGLDPTTREDRDRRLCRCGQSDPARDSLLHHQPVPNGPGKAPHGQGPSTSVSWLSWCSTSLSWLSWPSACTAAATSNEPVAWLWQCWVSECTPATGTIRLMTVYLHSWDIYSSNSVSAGVRTGLVWSIGRLGYMWHHLHQFVDWAVSLGLPVRGTCFLL